MRASGYFGARCIWGMSTIAGKLVGQQNANTMAPNEPISHPVSAHTEPTPPAVTSFIERWVASGANERANYTLFLTELCDLLGVSRPDPSAPDDRDNAYVFERSVPLVHEGGRTTSGRIDLYKRGSFVLEAKQGATGAEESPLFGVPVAPQRRGHGLRGTRAWDDAMQRAKNQAERYARSLPADEGRPPFVIVVDVGHSIALYSEFTRTGGAYIPFPDQNSYRIPLEDLAKPEVRELLKAVWTDPSSLDPSIRSGRVTREIADKLARLAKSLEADGHDPDTVSSFLMRAIFTMFAEDVGLLPPRAFKDLLESLRGHADHFADHVQALWEVMNTGGYSRDLRVTVLHFNGGLFANPTALPVSEEQLELLIAASNADWRDVEPAIFGTLLERALDPRERHKLGAHYTPRAYVERLVRPTLIDPLREEWQGVQAAASQLMLKGRAKDAAKAVEEFHKRLTSIRVLDPAAGSGNFLYVSLELMKRLEGEVLEALHALTGQDQTRLELAGATVSPDQFLGIEINPRAANLTNLVLWLGYLQWHFRTHGNVLPPQPVLHETNSIECRDALIEFDKVEPLLDLRGQPVTRWDGRTTKPHAITGYEVPDEAAQVADVRYINARPAKWPAAEFIVSNPPFVGSKYMRAVLGHGYTEAVRDVYDVPESADFVMFWWEHAAKLVRDGAVRRFGFITTNSIRQAFNRRVLEKHLIKEGRLSLVYAVPDHPWVDASDGAAVRISMTVVEAGDAEGTLVNVAAERKSGGDSFEVTLVERAGRISPDLNVGTDVAGAVRLRSNRNLSNRGVQLFGAGFIVTPEEARDLGLGRVPGLERHIRPYLHGRDITQTPRGVMVIDLFGLSVDEVREQYPAVYQHVANHVKPERDHNNRKSYRDNWWLFGEPRRVLREQLAGLNRFIVTPVTAKHRVFTFLDETTLPDDALIAFATTDAYGLGVLSSRVHVTWALATGGTLEDRPRYNPTRCFETFPFPEPSDQQRARIRDLAEQLDAHRKERLAEHDDLTITKLYNVLEKRRSGEELTSAELGIYTNGLVGVLRELHDDLDAAVLEAYGWDADLTDEQILEALVALNRERAREEAAGHVRWLRPEFQNPEGLAIQPVAGFEETAPDKKVEPQPWPATLPEQAKAVRAALQALQVPVTPAQASKAFKNAPKASLTELLETLAALGQVVKLKDGRFVS